MTDRRLIHTTLAAVLLFASAAAAQPFDGAPPPPPPQPQPQPMPQPMPPPPATAPGICVTIDPGRDTLTEQERVAARGLVLHAFESEQLAIDSTNTSCTEVYTVSNMKLGNTINVTITGPRGQRTGRATTLDDLANVYSQMVKSLVTGAPMGTGGSTDRTNVTKEQSAPRRVAADSLRYLQLGYGGVVAGRFAYGPAFGGGYRKELDRIGLDISIAFLLANDTDVSDGVTLAIPKLLAVWYQDPIKDGTVYYGGGISYGLTGVHSDATTYTGSGMQLHAVVGYEAFRSSTIRGFLQFETTLPLYKSEGDVSGVSERRYTPSLFASLGFGWGKTTNVVRVINE